MSDFTKGEWELRGNKIFVKGTNNSVAQVHVQKNYEDVTFKPITDVEAEANARLLIAAPKLLENLKRLINRIEENNLQDYFPSAFKRAKNLTNLFYGNQ